VDGLKVSEAGAHTGWSPRMLRYLERLGLVSPHRTSAGYRLYGLRDLNQLRLRLRREPELRKAVDAWFAGADDLAWVEWEQRKQERLLAA
jgi:MerR family copper efflux transcriptional regulator